MAAPVVRRVVTPGVGTRSVLSRRMPIAVTELPPFSNTRARCAACGAGAPVRVNYCPPLGCGEVDAIPVWQRRAQTSRDSTDVQPDAPPAQRAGTNREVQPINRPLALGTAARTVAVRRTNYGGQGIHLKPNLAVTSSAALCLLED